MIRHSKKDGNKKNHTPLRETIIARVAKHSRYPLDLYNTCARGSALTRPEFLQLLKDMHADGDIHINTDNLVVLPKPPPEAPEPKPPPDAPTPPREIENSTDTLLIHCLVNRSHTLKHPKQKKSLKINGYYAHPNYKISQIPLDSVCEETLLKGFQFVPGTFEWLDKRTEKRDGDIIVRKTRISDGECVSEKKSPDRTGAMKEGETTTERIIRDGDAWTAQQLFLVEFDDDTTESTLAEFIAARPFLRENAWLVTESLRSRYDDPDDETCNGQLRLRIVLCMPRAVKTIDEREWVCEALLKVLPGCDKKSAKSITNGGIGKVGAEHVKLKKIVDTDWFNTAIATGQQKKVAEAAESARLEEERKQKQVVRAAMGFTEREGELPLEALAKSDPSHFLESLGLSLKSESGKYQHWGRTEKQGDIALSVWLSEKGNYQIRVFANSIPQPPGVSDAMPLARFYCYHEFNTEEPQSGTQQWKDLNAQLANSGYGTWLSDDEFNALHAPTKKCTYTPAVRLSVSEYKRETQEIEQQQDNILAKLREWEANTRNSLIQHILNITTAAGTRKTTIGIHHIDTLLYIAQTTEEADQAFLIAERLERDAWRHRPRMYNRKNEFWHLLPLGLASNERPCIHPETCNTLAQRGHAPAISFCQERCEVYDNCRQKGFLAQTEIERKKQSVFLAWNEAFFSDEQFKSRVKLILNKEKMLVLDEADPAGLPQHRQFDLYELLSLLEAWRLPDPKAIPVFSFLENLIQTLSTAKEPEQIRDAIRECVKDVADAQRQDLDDALSKIPLGVVWDTSDEGLEAILVYGNAEKRVVVSDTRQPPKGYDGTIPVYFAEKGVEIEKLQLLTVSLDVFDRAGFLRISEDPEKAPRRFTSLVKDLQRFADSASTACHRRKSVIEFYLPPGLNAPRGITLTASDKDDLIREGYRGTGIEVETLTGLPPPFKSGCKYFQISTGRYTAKTALLKKEDGALTGIHSIFKRTLDVILKVADRYEVLVVAPKDALNAQLDPRIESLHTHPKIEAINHHHAEGRNDYQHCDAVFLFHFEPSADEIENIARRIYRNTPLNFDRETTDVEVDGVKLAGVMRYKDERLQKVYDRECESRHMQSLMRLRPMINPNKLMFSFSAEPVSRIPVAPVPFTLQDLENFILHEDGDLADFQAYLENKATQSVKEIQEQDKVSEKTAYRRTQKQRADAKAKDIEIVCKLKDQGLSIRQIVDQTGFSKGKVEGILKKHKVS